MTQRNKPRDAAVFGIDIGKNTFHVVGLDGTGAPIQRATFRRDTLLQFFERAARTVDWDGSLSRLPVARPQAEGFRDIRCASSRPSS